jgi:hypothetical protein
MTHLSDDELVLHFYGEGDDLRGARMHIEECEDCRRRFEQLSETLQAMTAGEVPERGEDYGTRVWARIQPKLEAPEPRSWRHRLFPIVAWPRLAMAGGAVALVVAAFAAGRNWPAPVVPAPPAESARAEGSSETARERILLVAVGEHLDRSRVLLTEIANRNGGGTADISLEQATAADLVATNRLYRQATVRNGDPAVAAVLEDLERVLVEIASSPSSASHDDLARWREQIDTTGLLFKVTLMGSRVRQRQQDAATASRPGVKSST